jgi:hypothetical protein
MTAIAETLRQTIDIGQVLKRAWHFFIDDIAPLLLGMLIATGLSIVTLGILAGPLYAGLYGMTVRRIRDGKAAAIGDVFSEMGRFWSFFAAALVLVVLIGLASITIVGGFLLATIWLYVFPIMVDRGVGLGEAMRVSKDLVMKAGFWEHLALVILFLVIGSLGWPVTLVTTPFAIAAVTVGYFLASGRDELVERN